MMLQRLHGERLLKDARSGLQVHQRVVHRLAAGDLGDASAKLDGLGYVKAADILAFAVQSDGAAGGGVA